MNKNWLIDDYTVIEAQTHRYTSTSVSGGGGQVTNSEHGMQSQINPISSTTHFHQDQEIWVRDLKTKNEKKLSFNEINLDVRPGHRMLVLTDPNTNIVERIYTQTSSLYYPGNWNYKYLKTRFKVGFFSTFKSILVVIPGIGFIGIVAVIHELFLSNAGVIRHAKNPIKMKLIILAAINFWSFYFAIQASEAGSRFFATLIILTTSLIFAWYLAKKTNELNEYVQAQSDDIDKVLTNYIHSITP